MFKVNDVIMHKVKSLHNAWIRRGNVFALLEANYLIDFYCTHVINYCDSSNQFNPYKTILPHQQMSRAKVWDGNHPTYDVFKQFLTYTTGWENVKTFVMQMRKAFLRNLVALAPDQVSPYIDDKRTIIPLDWRVMLSRYSLKEYGIVAYNTLKEFTTYNASGWGLYRLVNLNNFEDKQPSSCITNSLLLLTMFFITGFPQKELFAYFQVPDFASKKYSHWATMCRNPFSSTPQQMEIDTISTLHEKEVRMFWSSEAFASYTRDIVRYYMNATTSFNYSHNSIPAHVRQTVLKDLVTKYDAAFAHIKHKIKTPPSSRSQ